MQRPGPRIRLVVPGNVRHNSGGNVFNAALAGELAASGAEVRTCPLDGGWPVGSAEDRRRLAAVLRGPDAGPDHGPEHAGEHAGEHAAEEIVLVDGLLACGVPDELEEAAAAGRPVWILLHMPLDQHPALERRALNAAAGVICTSSSAAAGIRARHGFDRARVALPGTGAAARAAGSQPPHLIAAAALLPNKDQSLLIAALARLTDLPWTASLPGSDTADPGYAALLRDTVERLGLRHRIAIPGELRGAALEAEWAAADLSLLISRAESYGLVVTESLARGIPVVVRGGTGAVEALAAGNTVPVPGTAVALADDPAPLADVLRHWLTDPGLRARWRDAALTARDRLPGWDTTARTVLAILEAGTPVGGPARVRSAGGQAVGE